MPVLVHVSVLVVISSVLLHLEVNGKPENNRILTVARFVDDALVDDGSGDCSDCVCVNGTNGKDGKDGKDGASIVGPRGPPGPPGINGAPGVDGRNGADGKQGPRGEKGYRGSPGPRGPPGVCDQQLLDTITQDIANLKAKVGTLQETLDKTNNTLNDKITAVVKAVEYWKNELIQVKLKATQDYSKLSAAIKKVNDSRIPGPPGPQGEQGPRGNQGPQGDMGPRGPQGQLGPRGPKGDRGSRGPQGESGISALKGCKHRNIKSQGSAGKEDTIGIPGASPGHVIVGVACSSEGSTTNKLVPSVTSPYVCKCIRSKDFWSHGNFGDDDDDDDDDDDKRTVVSKRIDWGMRRRYASRRRRIYGRPMIYCIIHYWECPVN